MAVLYFIFVYQIVLDYYGDFQCYILYHCDKILKKISLLYQKTFLHYLYENSVFFDNIYNIGI